MKAKSPTDELSKKIAANKQETERVKKEVGQLLAERNAVLNTIGNTFATQS